MPGIDGIKTAEKIREYTEEVFIVFVTSFISYALEGYKVGATRKPYPASFSSTLSSLSYTEYFSGLSNIWKNSLCRLLSGNMNMVW